VCFRNFRSESDKCCENFYGSLPVWWAPPFTSLRGHFVPRLYRVRGIWPSFLALLILGGLPFLELAVLRGFLAPIFGISPVLAFVWDRGHFLSIFCTQVSSRFLGELNPGWAKDYLGQSVFLGPHFTSFGVVGNVHPAVLDTSPACSTRRFMLVMPNSDHVLVMPNFEINT
jgi:hypothetical protein